MAPQYDLLIGGGVDDMNLECLAVAAEDMGKRVGRFYHKKDESPDFAWPLHSASPDSAPIWQGQALQAKSAFMRYDVFTEAPGASGADRALGWHTPLMAWILAHDDIRFYNRHIDGQAGLKPYTLVMAVRHGLRIPDTLISNNFDAVGNFADSHGDCIVKPVMGGAYTRNLATVMENREDEEILGPMPAIVQRKLSYPEYRVFLICGEIYAFRLHSNYVDYRPAKDNHMVYIGNELPSDDVAERLRALVTTFACDFCACDFKSDPESGDMVFLELNTGPMFAAFDANANGALTRAMVQHLCK